MDVADFLWATTDVALWSSTESGIGITAAACATLRPLVRKVFGNSMRGTESQSQGWQKTGASKAGYLRSTAGGMDDFALRNDIESRNGVKTTIVSGGDDVELSDSVYGSRGRAESTTKLKQPVGWSQSDRLSDDEDDLKFGAGKNTGWEVRKTTVQTMHTE